MSKIVVSFQPFDALQQVTVIEDNGTIALSETLSQDRLSNSIYGLATRFNIDEVVLKGNTDYLEKYKAELGTRFSNREVNIHII